MSPAATVSPSARRAGVEDAAALVSLRAVMFDAMGVAAGGTDAAWRPAAEAWFVEWLARPTLFAAFLVDDPSLGVVSAACGICDARAPGPGGLRGVRGQVFNIATEPRYRRRGHARACVTALLRWFDQDTSVEAVELNASPDGARLYSSLGFRPRGHPTMRLSLATSTDVIG